MRCDSSAEMPGLNRTSNRPATKDPSAGSSGATPSTAPLGSSSVFVPQPVVRMMANNAMGTATRRAAAFPPAIDMNDSHRADNEPMVPPISGNPHQAEHM